MLARWLRCLTFFNLALIVGWCLWAWPRSPWLALIGVVIGLLSGKVWLGLQFLTMVAFKKAKGLACPAPAQVMHAWSQETRESARQFMWQMPWAEWAAPDHVPDSANGQRGVVLVHGWMCNRAVWTQALEQLRAQNIPCIAVSLPLLLHRIETARPTLDAALRRMHAATGVAPLVMAHSMGGLVVRDWLRSVPADPGDRAHLPGDVLTIGSPHHGSLLAHCVLGANVEQMRPRSEWLQALERDEAQPGSAFSNVRWHCAFADCDNVVFPESTSQLAGAQPHLIGGYAHVQMLTSPQLWDVARALLVRAQR